MDARPVGTSERGTKFKTRFGALELLNTTSGVGGYEGWVAGAERVTLIGGLRVSLAARADIDRNKRAAGRDKDAAHIELLAKEPDGARALSGAEQLLGSRPEQAAAARRWDGVAAMIDRYRERYSATDDHAPLGPEPTDLDQLRDWRRAHRLAEQVRDAAAPGA